MLLLLSEGKQKTNNLQYESTRDHYIILSYISTSRLKEPEVCKITEVNMIKG